MDLVPDSVGRDNSGSDGFSFRNATPTGARHQAPTNGNRINGKPVNGASHRAKDHTTAEEMAARATADPEIAEHPLIQGLLIELPDRNSTPPPVWLDRWLEAARAILELLYTQRPGQ